MAAGFRSPLFLLGLSLSPSQAGLRTFLAFWMGGGGSSGEPAPVAVAVQKPIWRGGTRRR